MTEPKVDFANRLTKPVTLRWPTFPDTDLKFSIAVYKGGRDVVLAQGSESNLAKLSDLGFSQIAGEWMLPEVVLSPRELREVFPTTVIEAEKIASEIYLDRTSSDAPTFPEVEKTRFQNLAERIAQAKEKREWAREMEETSAPKL